MQEHRQDRRRADRSKANERYRHEFLVQSAGALRELAALLTEEPEASDSVCFDLRRLAETAGSLELPIVGQAATDAADDVQDGRSPTRALRKVAHALRKAGGRLRFGPVVLVGPDLPDTDAAGCCEPVAVYADVNEFLNALLTEEPNAVVLPVQAIELVEQLVQRDSFPVFVHGPHTATDALARALHAGARGYVLHPVTLANVLDLFRTRSQPFDEPAEVLVIAPPSIQREQLVDGLMSVGLAAHPVEETPQVLLELEARPIKAVVVWVDVGGHSAVPHVRLVRAHPRYAHLPILAFAHAEDANVLRALGAEDAMRVDVTPAQAAQRVRERIDRLTSLPWSRDPATGLLNRLGVLGAIDAQLARTFRTDEVLSVVLVEVDGLRTPDLDNAAVHRARRLVGELLRRHVRRTDPVGELALGELVLALPTCPRAIAERRMAEVARIFGANVASDPELSSLRLEFGVADTKEGTAGIGARAERALRRGVRPP